MKKEPLVLNWFAKDKKLTKGLVSRLRKNNSVFITMRLGPKWCDQLMPGDIVAISISDDPEKPSIVGYVTIGRVYKDFLYLVDNKHWKRNIGVARNWRTALKNMRSVYGEDEVDWRSVVSVIECVVV